MIEKQKIEIGSNTVFRVILILLGLWFLFIIQDILMMLIGAFVIAAAIEPVARYLQRYKVPRALSVVIVYFLVLLVLGASLVLIAPALAQQTAQLAQSLPDLLVDLQSRLGLQAFFDVDQVLPSIQNGLRQVSDNLANIGVNIFQQTRNVFSGIFSFLFVLIIAFYLVIEEDGLKKSFRIIIPANHMAYVETILDRITYKLGRWVLAQLALGVIIGVVVGVGLWLMGVPHALPLGLIAGVLEIIPVIGPIIAGVFGIFVALSQSLLLGVGAVVFYVVVQQLENHVLIPSIMRKATGLNPLVTLIAVLVGARLAGVVGVILSVPVATMLSIFLSDFLRNSSVEDELAG
ncbi:MAG: AI-2E family transporter [Candidatus Andersenbacteria bacterium]|nr:AI-2E family transporter [Candidatus Andersenbacteria bacterium]MBI3250997.1 AI-2E family transporter [Candidatus Andersenbacteria bacterium]